MLASIYQVLPTGGALQHAISNVETPKGNVLEGRGVILDITVKLSRADLLAGRDSVPERAVGVVSTMKNVSIY